MGKQVKKKPAKKLAAKKPVKKSASVSKSGSKTVAKYDQPGAPWWKKFRPTESRGGM